MWKKIGVRAEINVMDEAEFMRLRKSGGLSGYTALWTADFNDPDNVIFTFFGSKDNTKIRSNNYSDDATIARVADARGIVDQNERMAEYAALEKKLVQFGFPCSRSNTYL